MISLLMQCAFNLQQLSIATPLSEGLCSFWVIKIWKNYYYLSLLIGAVTI